jgi:O-antigen/teichoic acid export membrane protein
MLQNPWKRLLKGLGANAFGQFLTVVIQIVSVPLFIRMWGVDLYGEWLILMSIPTYLALSDFGFGSAAANEMTMRVAQGDRAGALSIFQSTWLLISLIGLIILLISLPLIWVVPIAGWLNLSHISSLQTAEIILLMTLKILISQQAIFSVAGFQCEGYYAQGILYLNFMRLFEFSALSLVVYCGGTPVIAALANLCAVGLGSLGMGLALSKLSPWMVYGYRHATFSQVKQLALPAIAFMGFPAANALSNQGITLVIGTFLGPAAVVLFSTQRTLSRFVWQILNVITNSVRPELSIAFGAGNLRLARQLHRRSCQAAIWIATLAAIILLVAGEWIINAWTGGKVAFDSTLFHIMLAIVIVNSFWNTSQAVPIAINRHQRLALSYATSALLALILALWLMHLWGLNGAALSLLVIDAAMSIYVIGTSLSLVDDKFTDFLVEVMMPPVRMKHFLQFLKR